MELVRSVQGSVQLGKTTCNHSDYKSEGAKLVRKGWPSSRIRGHDQGHRDSPNKHVPFSLADMARDRPHGDHTVQDSIRQTPQFESIRDIQMFMTVPLKVASAKIEKRLPMKPDETTSAVENLLLCYAILVPGCILLPRDWLPRNQHVANQDRWMTCGCFTIAWFLVAHYQYWSTLSI